MQVHNRIAPLTTLKKDLNAPLSGHSPSDDQLRTMPAPARVNGLQWELSSPQERRQLLESQQEHKETASTTEKATTLAGNLNKAAMAHDAAKTGDYLGAVSSGSSALQGFKGDKVLQFIGGNTNVLSTAEQAIKTDNFAAAGETLYKNYGGAISPAVTRSPSAKIPLAQAGTATSPQKSDHSASSTKQNKTAEAQTSPAELSSPAKPELLGTSQQKTQGTSSTMPGQAGGAKPHKNTLEKETQSNILAETSQKETHSEGRGVESSPDTKPVAETSEESLSAFTKGVVAGDFYENDSWSATAGKIVGGLAPPADARDVAAAVTHIAQGKEGAWSDLGWSLIGSVPLIGDTIKAIGKGSDVARGATKASGKTVDGIAASGKTADEVGVGGGKNTKTRLPRKDGKWDGKPGEGNWHSDLDDVNKVTGGKPIPFKNGRPDFSEWSKGSVKFKQGQLDGTKEDFNLVYDYVADKKGLASRNAAKNYLREKGLTPHHLDNNTIQVVPSKLHGNIPHIGSASDLREGF